MPTFRGQEPPSKTALAEQVYQDLLGRGSVSFPVSLFEAEGDRPGFEDDTAPVPGEDRLALRLRFHLAARECGL